MLGTLSSTICEASCSKGVVTPNVSYLFCSTESSVLPAMHGVDSCVFQAVACPRSTLSPIIVWGLSKGAGHQGLALEILIEISLAGPCFPCNACR